MIEWKLQTSDEIAKLDRHLPVLLPVGLIEAHGPHLPLSVDAHAAEYFARHIAQESGAILAPALAYGFADEMAEYPGTVGLTADTAIAVFTDLLSTFCRQGFLRVIVLSGHGANKIPFEVAIQRVWKQFPFAQLAYWNYWSEAGFNNISHADKGETEIAMAIGIPAHMDRARDFKVAKPWFRLRSRFAINPDSGGVNGAPSAADPRQGEQMRDQIIRALAERVRKIIADPTEGA